MENETQEEVIIDSPETNEEVEVQAEAPEKVEKPKRTPEQELEYFEGRAKRLRKDLGLEDKKEEVKVDSSITARDVLLLTGAGYTHEEDIEVIEKWAKFNGVSVKDALNDNTLKTILSTKQEERRTAQATQTKGSARGVSTPSIDTIIAEANKGKLPEKDSDIERLAEARMAKRLEGLK